MRQTLDDAGGVLATTNYDPWGTPQDTLSVPFGFTGDLHRAGQVSLRARWYDPAQGRFLQRDSFAGGPTRPQSLNRYAYTENNPVNWTDPSGYAGVPRLALLLVGVTLTRQSSTPRETITPGEATAGTLGLALMGAGAVWMVAPAVVPAAQQVSAYAVAHPAGTATMTRLTLAGGVLGAASDTVMVTQALRGDPDAVGDLIVAQQLAAMDGGLPFGNILTAGMLVSRRGLPADFITLYHGTSSNRAAKIVGSAYYSPRGFRRGIDDAVYFTGGNPPFDLQSAESWAVGAINSGSQARSFTVIRFDIPGNLARDLGLIDEAGTLKRIPVGQYRDASFQDLPDPYEIVLTGDHIDSFNQALLEGHVIFQRYRLQHGGKR